MGLLSFLRGRIPRSKSNCPGVVGVVGVVEDTEVKKRRAATIRGRVDNTDEQKLQAYLSKYTEGEDYGVSGGELTVQTIKTLAMAMFKAGYDSKTIISGLPKYPDAEPEYAECGSEPVYEPVKGSDLTVEEKKTAALGLIEGINKLLLAGIKKEYINAIVDELKELKLTTVELGEAVKSIDEKNRHATLQTKVDDAVAAGGGKRARRVRRTKRTKGKSRGRAGKATRVRRNNNNSNKTKRNKGKKRRTKRA
jgi:hypothetical protein